MRKWVLDNVDMLSINKRKLIIVILRGNYIKTVFQKSLRTLSEGLTHFITGSHGTCPL